MRLLVMGILLLVLMLMMLVVVVATSANSKEPLPIVVPMYAVLPLGLPGVLLTAFGVRAVRRKRREPAPEAPEGEPLPGTFRKWVAFLAVGLGITGILLPVTILLVILEKSRAKKEYRTHYDRIVGTLILDSPPPAPPAPIPPVEGVLVAPNIPVEGMQGALATAVYRLGEREHVIAVWEAKPGRKDAPNILLTDRRAWIYPGAGHITASPTLESARNFRRFDHAYEQLRSAIIFDFKRKEMLYVNGEEVLDIRDQHRDAVHAMVAWMRAAAGPMPESIVCPECASGDIVVKPVDALPGDKKLLGRSAKAGFMVGAGIKAEAGWSKYQTDQFRRLLREATAQCGNCEHSWQLQTEAA